MAGITSTPVPQVQNEHIQATLNVLWQSDPAPAFLAAVLAKYSRTEPSLRPLVNELITQLDEYDRGFVQSRLAAPPNTNRPDASAETEPPAWYIEWVAVNTPVEVRVDPEQGRLAMALKKTGEYLVWAIARHYHGQPGWVERQTLYESLQTARVGISRRHYNRLLKQGEGVFWGLASDGRVWLRSYIKVSRHLTRLAREIAPELVTTNIPGVRDVYLKVSGSVGDFKTQVYAGWLTYRQDPKIARDTLCTLFACTKDTLRNWEKRLGSTIEIITNWSQSAVNPLEDDTIVDYLPDHAYAYVTRRGQIRLRWRQPNRYKTRNIREHHCKGQSRKARFASAVAAWYQPVEICAHKAPDKIPFDRSHRVSKRYFSTVDELRRLLKRLEKQDVPGITPATPRYVYRGQDHNDHGIYELSLDGEVCTTAWERMPLKAEYMWWKGYNVHLTQLRAG